MDEHICFLLSHLNKERPLEPGHYRRHEFSDFVIPLPILKYIICNFIIDSNGFNSKLNGENNEHSSFSIVYEFTLQNKFDCERRVWVYLPSWPISSKDSTLSYSCNSTLILVPDFSPDSWKMDIYSPIENMIHVHRSPDSILSIGGTHSGATFIPDLCVKQSKDSNNDLKTEILFACSDLKSFTCKSSNLPKSDINETVLNSKTIILYDECIPLFQYGPFSLDTIYKLADFKKSKGLPLRIIAIGEKHEQFIATIASSLNPEEDGVYPYEAIPTMDNTSKFTIPIPNSNFTKFEELMIDKIDKSFFDKTLSLKNLATRFNEQKNYTNVLIILIPCEKLIKSLKYLDSYMKVFNASSSIWSELNKIGIYSVLPILLDCQILDQTLLTHPQYLRTLDIVNLYLKKIKTTICLPDGSEGIPFIFDDQSLFLSSSLVKEYQYTLCFDIFGKHITDLN